MCAGAQMPKSFPVRTLIPRLILFSSPISRDIALQIAYYYHAIGEGVGNILFRSSSQSLIYYGCNSSSRVAARFFPPGGLRLGLLRVRIRVWVYVYIV
jgi:hypothetical protein